KTDPAVNGKPGERRPTLQGVVDGRVGLAGQPGALGAHPAFQCDNPMARRSRRLRQRHFEVGAAGGQRAGPARVTPCPRSPRARARILRQREALAAAEARAASTEVSIALMRLTIVKLPRGNTARLPNALARVLDQWNCSSRSPKQRPARTRSWTRRQRRQE